MTNPTVRAFYFKQKYTIQMPLKIRNMEHIIYRKYAYIYVRTIQMPSNKYFTINSRSILSQLFGLIINANFFLAKELYIIYYEKPTSLFSSQ